MSNLSQYLVVVNLMLSVAARTPTQKLNPYAVSILSQYLVVVFV